MHELLNDLFSGSAGRLIATIQDHYAAHVVAAVAIVLSLLEYLSQPRVSYLVFPSYAPGEFAVLVVNMDAAPLGLPLVFPVHAARVTAVRAFPDGGPSGCVEVAWPAPDRVELRVHRLADEDSLMLVFEHGQGGSLPQVHIGDADRRAGHVRPRDWAPLRPLSLARRFGRASVRVVPGLVTYIALYAILRRGFAYPADEWLQFQMPAWDAAIVAIGCLAVAVAYWMSNMDRGRRLAIPFEAAGTARRFIRA